MIYVRTYSGGSVYGTSTIDVLSKQISGSDVGRKTILLLACVRRDHSEQNVFFFKQGSNPPLGTCAGLVVNMNKYKARKYSKAVF